MGIAARTDGRAKGAINNSTAAGPTLPPEAFDEKSANVNVTEGRCGSGCPPGGSLFTMRARLMLSSLAISISALRAPCYAH
jgi:hypothetical protein